CGDRARDARRLPQPRLRAAGLLRALLALPRARTRELRRGRRSDACAGPPHARGGRDRAAVAARRPDARPADRSRALSRALPDAGGARGARRADGARGLSDHPHARADARVNRGGTGMADTRMLDRGELDAATHPDLKPPSFSSLGEEGAHRKARLAGACRIFARYGYDHWVAGHLSVRDPEHADRFWVNPLGVSWHRIRVSDLVQVDFAGEVTEGNRP